MIHCFVIQTVGYRKSNEFISIHLSRFAVHSSQLFTERENYKILVKFVIVFLCYRNLVMSHFQKDFLRRGNIVSVAGDGMRQWHRIV